MMRYERNRQLVNKSSHKAWKLTGAFVASEPAQVTVHAATHSSAVKVDEATVEDQKVSLNEAVAPEEATEEVEYEYKRKSRIRSSWSRITC